MRRSEIKEWLWLVAINDGDAYRQRVASMAVNRAMVSFFKVHCHCGRCVDLCLGMRAALIQDLLDWWKREPGVGVVH